MTGRPTIRTPEIVDEILERVTAGEPLAQVLRSEGMPKPSTFYDWINADEVLSGQFARAREYGADAIAVDTLRIADDEPGTTPQGTVDGADVMNRKLRIETRLKLLAKWDRRYGEKFQVDGPGAGGSHLIQVVTGVPHDAED